MSIINIESFTDKYFIRTKRILQKLNLNPYVRTQVFIRKGPGVLSGINEVLKDVLNIKANIYALPEGSDYKRCETLMYSDSKIQSIVDLETVLLGIISCETTKLNDKIDINPKEITKIMKLIVKAANGRPVSYFGARHWRYDKDFIISEAAFKGGAVGCSTDAGAKAMDGIGGGTIPHSLEAIMSWKYGANNAVVKALEAFDKVIESEVPRIALIDYNNKEVDDSIKCAELLGDKLTAVRVDTCGENLMQGALLKPKGIFEDLKIPKKDMDFWFGPGVTISGVYNLRKQLDEKGFKNVNILLTSGFGNPDKVKAFSKAEDLLKTKLYDGLGVGAIYPSRAATMDVVMVGEDPDHLLPISKVGRKFEPNPRLVRVKSNLK